MSLWPGRVGRGGESEAPGQGLWVWVRAWGQGLTALRLCTEPVAPGPPPPVEQPRARHLEALQRQLQVELKVKQGAENMTRTCATGTPKVRLLGSGGRGVALRLFGEGLPQPLF